MTEKKGYLCDICKVRICRKRPHSCAVEHGVCECFVCGLRFSSSKAMFRHRNLAHPVDTSANASDIIEVFSSAEPRKPTTQYIQPSIDSLLEKTLLLGEQEQEEITFQNHPALQYFHLTENTVICCENVIYLKCPLCLDAFDRVHLFKEHIESYPFLPEQKVNEFFESVSEIIADLTTMYLSPTNNECEA